jgi:hypothetical protein
MGEIWHLPRLRLNPEAFSNTVRMRLVIVTPRVSNPHDYANHMFMRL